MSEKSRSVALMVSQSIPLLVWMQLAVNDIHSRVTDLSQQVKRLEQQAISLHEQLNEHNVPGKK